MNLNKVAKIASSIKRNEDWNGYEIHFMQDSRKFAIYQWGELIVRALIDSIEDAKFLVAYLHEIDRRQG